jgi:hypothetical protein
MRAAILLSLSAVFVAHAAASAQVEVDRTVQHVYGVAIMASDIRQARLLNLVPGADQGDKAVQTALENRLLMLREISQAAPAEPTAEAIALRRQSWREAQPAGQDVADLMRRTGMTELALNGWFRDDLRIEAYLDQRFGQEHDASRAARVDTWLAGLRRRANLNGKIG